MLPTITGASVKTLTIDHCEVPQVILHTGYGADLRTVRGLIDRAASPYRNSPSARDAIDRLCNMVGTDQFLWGTTAHVQKYNSGRPEYRYEYVLDVTDGDVIAILSGWLWQYILQGENSYAVPTNIYRRFRNAVGRADPKKCKAWLAVNVPSDPYTQLILPKDSAAALEPFDHVLIAWPFSQRTSILTVHENRTYWQG